MKDSPIALGLGAAFILVYIIDRLFQAWKNARLPPLPPGPKALPIVGNLRDMPKRGTFGARFWSEHREKYGPISSVSAFGTRLVIINEPDIAFDLLEKQAISFSSRPSLYVISEVVGWKNGTGALPYNDTLRTHRKHFARIIGSQGAASEYNKLQEAEVGHFILHVLEDPENLRSHIAKQAGSLILKMVYGYNTEQFKKDPMLAMMTKVMDDFATVGNFGAFLVDSLPSLRFVPEWFPGADWKRRAKQMAVELQEAVDKPYAFVENQIAEGKNSLSYLSRLMETTDATPKQIHDNKWTAASLYSGGSDTTVAAIAAFFLAMTIFPEVQKKAQEEIDRVTGGERLPNAEDRENLPYIEALVKETLRWHPIGPMGLAHLCTEDTVYRGYRIPKDSILVANVWRFTRDPAIYQDPLEFRPERHLSIDSREPETDPRKLSFGFGRRICPGRVLAENSMFLTFAQSLAVFDISKKVVDGKVVEPRVEFLPGVISHPADFETSIKPRSAHHEKLIRSIEETYPWVESDSKVLKRMELI
ncbi:cytochrome p450 oxidoreductase [Colletotrichum plurivorum]|uniref:Cytochrome p450 oxidoreductase n=1 Tax=Colletotrichum plurivorum TaxID=2175906 RepID=A0A8H6MVU7_9PEZI|nr:cytochrome p450 oxidoreductase [Colletotrichum plurivorum]